MNDKELQPRRECVVLVKMCKSRKNPKARKIPFPCGDQERVRNLGLPEMGDSARMLYGELEHLGQMLGGGRQEASMGN